jgi:hypothetical protein
VDSLHRPPIWAELYLDRTEVRAGASLPVLVRVALEDGWHLGDGAPGDALRGLAPRLEGDHAGFTLELAVPAGERRRLGGLEAAVLEGELLLRGALHVAPDAPAGPRLLRLRLDYQACDDSRCLAPATLGLRAEIAVGASGGSGAASP